MSSASTGVKGPDDRSAWYWASGKGLLDPWRRLGQHWPLAAISIGIIASFFWTAVLVWLLLGLIGKVV
jgi:hypothetical protein